MVEQLAIKNKTGFGLRIDSTLIAPLVALILASLLVAISTDRFLTTGNLKNIFLQVSSVSIMAIGSTVVILTGGIDLSPGSSVALLTMLLAMGIKFLGLSLPVAIFLVILVGLFLGMINGVLSTYLRIPAFIATLATMSAYRGISFMFNNGSPVFSVSQNLEKLFYGTILGIPVTLIYVAVLFACAYLCMKYTKLGREIYAVGGNIVAAKLSGININRARMMAFVIAGGMASISAILMTARLNSGSPNYGAGMEMSAIAATVVGGTSLSGGQGNVLSTLLGALTIVVVQNGLNLHAIPTSLQNIILGLIIVLAVAIDMWRNELSLLRTLIKKNK